MSLLEQQNLLARLYTDPNVREQFFAEPEKVGLDHGLAGSEIESLLAVARDEVSFFSESLVWKRLREVEKLLPLTRNALGEDFQKEFFRFAPTFNPQTVKKHYEDAIAFIRWIETASENTVSTKNTAMFDRTRLVFVNENRFFSFCRLSKTADRFESHEITPGRLGFAVWVRLGRRIFHFQF